MVYHAQSLLRAPTPRSSGEGRPGSRARQKLLLGPYVSSKCKLNSEMSREWLLDLLSGNWKRKMKSKGHGNAHLSYNTNSMYSKLIKVKPYHGVNFWVRRGNKGNTCPKLGFWPIKEHSRQKPFYSHHKPLLSLYFKRCFWVKSLPLLQQSLITWVYVKEFFLPIKWLIGN